MHSWGNGFSAVRMRETPNEKQWLIQNTDVHGVGCVELKYKGLTRWDYGRTQEMARKSFLTMLDWMWETGPILVMARFVVWR